MASIRHRKPVFAVITLFFLNPTLAMSQPLNEDFKMHASDGAAGDRFGLEVAIDDGLAAVGTSNGFTVYQFDVITGNEIGLITESAPAAGSFGYGVAIENGTLTVGSPDRTAYTYDALSGNLLTTFEPNDSWQIFGSSVAIANGLVAVGDPWNRHFGFEHGAAYLFNATTGTQLFKLLGDDLSDDSVQYDDFGCSIDIYNGVVAVGAPGDNPGAVYLFDATTGQQTAKLVPDNSQDVFGFGIEIAIDDGIAVIGAYRDSNLGSQVGSAFIFDIATGNQLFKLYPDDTAERWFGRSVDIMNGLIAIGAPRNTSGGDQTGAAYLFDASTGMQISKLLPSDGAADDSFGFSIAMDDNTVIVGATGDDDIGEDSGSAYVFLLSDPACPADTNGDGQVTPTDFTAWINAFNNNLHRCDQNNDGVCTPTDFTAWINNFNAGCD